MHGMEHIKIKIIKLIAASNTLLSN